MGLNLFKINRGLSLTPQASAPADPTNGDLYYDSVLNKFQKYENGAWSDISGGINTCTYLADAGEDLLENDAIYLSAGSSDNGRTQWRAYKLDPTNPARSLYAGLVTADTATGDTATIQVIGEKDNFTGLPITGFVYASVTTPGSWQVAPPTGGLQAVIILGQVSTSSSKLLISGALNGTAKNNPASPQNGYAASGTDGTYLDIIQALNFGTEVVSTISAVLTNARAYGAGGSSGFKGYVIGGRSGVATFYDTIDSLTFVGQTVALVGATISSTRYETSSASSSLATYTLGGREIAGFAVVPIDKLIFNTETTAVVVDVLSSAAVGCAGVQSDVKVFAVGGQTGAATARSTIDALVFATESVYTSATSLSSGKSYYGCGLSAGTKGYACGGLDGNVTYYTAIESLDYTTEAIMPVTAVLSGTTSFIGTCWTPFFGYLFGGYTGAGLTNVINKLTFNTEVISVLAATLSGNRVGINSGVQG